MGNSIQKMAFLPPISPGDLDPKGVQWISCGQHRIPLLEYQWSRSKYVLVYSHGNATDLGEMSAYLKYLSQLLHITVIGYEYLGYGYSQIGEDENTGCMIGCSFIRGNKTAKNFPSENGCYQSIEAVYQHLTQEKGIKPDKIIWMGQSIGSGPTIEIASRYPSAGVILVSPFRSAARVVTESSLARPLDFFCNEEKLNRVESHVFIVHGLQDQIIPWKHSRILYQILIRERGEEQYPALWIDGADHNNLHEYPEYMMGLKEFLEFIR